MQSDKREKFLLRFLESLNLKTNDIEVIDKSLTHPSYTNETGLSYDCNYERLEFLGDAVLKLVASNYLFLKYPLKHEGELTKIRSVLVSDACLEKLALNINLNKFIKLGKADFHSGKKVPASILACAFEGLLGGLYLSSDLKQIEDFLIKQFDTIIEDIVNNSFCNNAKAMLQEYTQSLNKDLPIYSVKNERGPEHNKTFEVEVYYNNQLLACANGKTKKEAQQNAATVACENLGILE